MAVDFKALFQDCNLNFLIGSGVSKPFLATLGKIEKLLTDLEYNDVSLEQKEMVRFALYCKYFDGAIDGNIDILESRPGSESVSRQYGRFLKIINGILLNRKSTIIGKEANLFTTNLDIFIEKSLETLGLEFNDGYEGRFPLYLI